MPYLFLFISVINIGINFCIEKFYQKKLVKNSADIFLFQIIVGVLTAFLFLCINGFSLKFSSFGFIMAGLYAAFCLYSVIGMIAVKYGKLSIYTMFLMIGGMLLPYIYAVLFLNETLNVCRIIGVILLVASLCVNSLCADKKETVKTKNIFWFLCFLVFLLNGGVSIVSKVHQINVDALSTNDFIIWCSLFKVVLSSLCYLCCFTKGKKSDSVEEKLKNIQQKSTISFAAISVVVSSLSTFLMLEAAKTIPATAQYPIVTGGVTIITTLLARLFFKEKLNSLQIFALCVMFLGTFLFVF